MVKTYRAGLWDVSLRDTTRQITAWRMLPGQGGQGWECTSLRSNWGLYGNFVLTENKGYSPHLLLLVLLHFLLAGVPLPFWVVMLLFSGAETTFPVPPNDSGDIVTC